MRRVDEWGRVVIRKVVHGKSQVAVNGKITKLVEKYVTGV